MTDQKNSRSRRAKSKTAVALRIIDVCGQAYPENPVAALDATTFAMFAMVAALKGEETAEALREHLVRFIEQRILLESASGSIQ